MSDPFIPLQLIPPGIADDRARAFTESLSNLLGSFQTSRLIVQDPLTAPAELLPMMIVEAGMTDFISPGMREDLVRQMLDAAPDIHALTGRVKGVRRALTALGISARWTQWYQTAPKGFHDTHKVVLYFNDAIIEGRPLLDPLNQQAIARVVAATKRWSQDISIQYGLRAGTATYAGLAGRRSKGVRINGPRLGDASFSVPTFFGTTVRLLRGVRIQAKV